MEKDQETSHDPAHHYGSVEKSAYMPAERADRSWDEAGRMSGAGRWGFGRRDKGIGCIWKISVRACGGKTAARVETADRPVPPGELYHAEHRRYGIWTDWTVWEGVLGLSGEPPGVGFSGGGTGPVPHNPAD